MWQIIAKEMEIPWRTAEAMHWQLGEQDMADRAGVLPFSLSSVAIDVSKKRAAPGSSGTAGPSASGSGRAKSQSPPGIAANSAAYSYGHVSPQAETYDQYPRRSE
jgi:hypothetical protein